MLQVRTSVVAGANGSRKAVVGSGTTSMSLSWIAWKPRIDEPSNPMPSSRVLAFTALGGTEKCCQTPGKSVNRRSIIWTFSSLIVLRTSSDVAQVGTMASLLQPRAAQITLPSGRGQAAWDGLWSTPLLRDAAAPASIRHGGGAFKQILSPASRQLQLWCGPRNCLGTVCFQQLPRKLVDFDFSHGATLLLFSARPLLPIGRQNRRR